MKKRKIAKAAATAVLSIMTIGASSAALAACGEKHEHSYGDWVITQAPTMTGTGKAERNCVDGDNVDSVTLPALNDDKVWTEDASAAVDPTHMADGSRTFTSEYGTVTITVPKTQHAYGTWEITKDPTMTEPGKAKHKCETDDYVQEIDIPALSDSVWTEKSDEHVAPTCKVAGKSVYESTYGTVTVVLPVDDTAHAYGAWSFVGGTKPTLTQGAQITRKCEHDNGHVETQPVPALTDSFWTKDVKSAPTHQSEGVADFKNATYGLEVKGVTLAKVPHTFGEWQVDGVTQESGGTITRVCTEAGCAEDPTATETHDVAKLTETSEWTAGEEVQADYNHAGSITYTHKTYEGLTVTFKTADKLVAPYDNKTYHSICFEIETGEGRVKKETAWTNQTLVIGADSVGQGTGAPFQGKIVFELENPATGKIKMTQYSNDGTTVRNIITAFVDMQTGVIVMQHNGSWDVVDVVVPTDVELASAHFTATTASGITVITYNNGSYNNYNVVLTGTDVFVGVTLEDINGGALTAESCFTPYGNIFVKKGGDTLKAFGHNGTNWVTTDEFVGKYAIVGGGTAVVNGVGHITVSGATQGNGSGTYTQVGDNVIGAIIEGNYYLVTLTGDGMSGSATCTVEIKKVTITLNYNGTMPAGKSSMTETLEDISMNVPYALPADLVTDTMILRGWFTDASCTNPVALVDGMYIPTDDVELFAKWVTKVTVNLVGLLDADSDKATLYLGAGDYVMDYLPPYERYQVDGTTYFDGWYQDDSYQTPVTDTDRLGTNTVTLYAHWVEIPGYVGSFQMFGVYGVNTVTNGSYYFKQIEISISGKITGDLDAQVVSYNKDTKELICTSGTTTFTFFFDAESGIMVSHYRSDFGTSNTFDPDTLLVGVNGVTSTSAIVTYGVHVNNNSQYLARFLTYNGHTVLLYKEGETAQMFSEDKFTVTTSLGAALATLDDIKNSKTLIVRNKATNAIIFAVASTGATFGNGNNTVALDEYYGVYEWDSHDNVTLDGAGTITMGDKSGTYTVAEAGSGYTLDVYLNGDTEYWRVTLNKSGNTYTAVKPVVTIHYVVGEYGNAVADEDDVNINIVHAMPTPTLADGKDGKFRGWYFDSEFENAVPANWAPEENADGYTLYAKWDVKATVTFCYNDGGAHPNETCNDLYVGDELGNRLPAVNFDFGQKIFVGWFTKDGTEDGDWGEQVTAATVISVASVEFIVRWANPAAMTGTYKGIEPYTDKNDQSFTVASSSYTLTVSNRGVFAGTRLNGTLSEDDLYVEEGAVIVGSQYTYVNKSLGLVIYGYYASSTELGKDLYVLFNPEVVTSVDYSGKAMAHYTLWMKVNFADSLKGSTNVFVYNERVYVGVSFSNGVTAKNASVNDHIVFDSTGNPIIGYKNKSFIEVDGYRGTYSVTKVGTEELDFTELTLDGIGTVTIDGKNGTYKVMDDGKISLTFADVYYEITEIDPTEHTCSVTKPMTTVIYESAQTTVPQESRNTNIAYALPALSDTETHVFRGWYKDAEFATKITGNFTPTGEEITVYAKWDIILNITVVYGKDIDNFTPAGKIASGDKLTLEDKGVVGGQVIDFFYIGSEDNKWVNGTAVVSDTAEVTIYAHWINAHALTGSYTGVEVYTFNGVAGQVNTFASGKSLTIGALGTVTAASSAGTSKDDTVDYNASTGVLKFVTSSGSYRFGYADADGGILIYTYSTTSSDELSNDLYFMTRGTGNTLVKADFSFWESKNAMLYTVRNNGNATNVFFYNGEIYVNVTYRTSAGDNSFAAGAAYSQTDLEVYDSKDHLIVKFIKDSNGNLKGLDGTQGDYTGTLAGVDGTATLTLNGVGGLKVNGGDLIDYTVSEDGNLNFVYNNRMYVVTISEGTFTQVQDGYQGTYTLPDDAGTITLDGFGGAGGNKTYVASGAQITIYDGESSTRYGLDVQGKKFLGKSIFAGKTFTGNSLSVVFDDDSAISGTLSTTTFPKYEYGFTAELVGNVLTFTITSESVKLGFVGKTFTATVSNGKITFTSSFKYDNVVDLNGKDVTCADFVYEG